MVAHVMCVSYGLLYTFLPSGYREDLVAHGSEQVQHVCVWGGGGGAHMYVCVTCVS